MTAIERASFAERFADFFLPRDHPRGWIEGTRPIVCIAEMVSSG